MGGFDGMKRNDMYRIVVDEKVVTPPFEEESKYTAIQSQEVQNENEDEKEREVYFKEDDFYNMTLKKWVRIKNIGSTYTPRTGHECLFFKDCIYLFGGTHDEDRKNDLYRY